MSKVKRTPEGWKTARLGELLTDVQGVQVGKFIGRKDAKGLHQYLKSIESDLKRKGVVADYLYYLLAYEFKLDLSK